MEVYSPSGAAQVWPSLLDQFELLGNAKQLRHCHLMLIGPSQHNTHPVGLAVLSEVGAILAVPNNLYVKREDVAEGLDGAAGMEFVFSFRKPITPASVFWTV